MDTIRVEKRKLRFDVYEAQEAADDWRFNCGPAALCAVLDMTPSEIRPHLRDFERKGYTNPSLMRDVLRDLRQPFMRVYECLGAKNGTPDRTPGKYPGWGLVRLQWGGPWTKPGVPVRVRYRHTHWVAMDGLYVFDINAMCVGGWIDWDEWANQLTPWLIRECEPKANGEWWPTHCWELRIGRKYPKEDQQP